MRAENHFDVIRFFAIFIAGSLWLAACTKVPGTADPVGALHPGNATAELTVVQPGMEISILDATQPTATNQETSLDGPALVASLCAHCHLAEPYEDMKKSRSEWVLILAQMESLGLKMSDSERTVLLDYLGGSTLP